MESDSLKVSVPTPTALQTVALTIIPTTVTILNDDNPDTANAAYEASTHSARDETDNNRDILNAWKRYEWLTKDNREDNTDNAPEECSGLSEICEKYRKTQKRTLTTTKQHELLNQFNNRHLNNGME